MSIGHQDVLQRHRLQFRGSNMALSGLSFLEEMASMNGVSADSSLAEDEEKLFNLFFSDGLEPSLGLQASGDFPELTSITEPSDTAEDSAEALAPPPPPPSRRKAPQAAPRSLKAASQSQEKSRCRTSCMWRWERCRSSTCSELPFVLRHPNPPLTRCPCGNICLRH